MLDEFDRARESLKWAREALAELDSATKTWASRVKAVSFTDVEPNTGCKLFKVKLSENPPSVLSRKVSESLLRTREAFDLSLYAACVAIKKTPKRDSHFPWATDPSDLDRMLEGRKGKAQIPPELWEVLRQQEPYFAGEGHAGGNNTVREFAKIANRKHNIGIAVAGYVSGGRLPDVYASFAPKLETLTPVWDPVKNEMTLVRYLGDAQIKNNYEFAFEIVMEQSGRVEPIGVLDGLPTFLDKAQSALEALEARAIEIRSS